MDLTKEYLNKTLERHLKDAKISEEKASEELAKDYVSAMRWNYHIIKAVNIDLIQHIQDYVVEVDMGDESTYGEYFAHQ